MMGRCSEQVAEVVSDLRTGIDRFRMSRPQAEEAFLLSLHPPSNPCTSLRLNLVFATLGRHAGQAEAGSQATPLTHSSGLDVLDSQ